MAIRKSIIILFLLGFTLSLFACQPQPSYEPLPDWKYADLRALDPAESIPPSQDLIAMYIRRVGKDVEIRLDLLDFSTPLDCDLSLTIDSSPHGEKVTINIPAEGPISALDTFDQPIHDLQPRISRDTFLDTIVISLNRSSLTRSGLPFEVQASTTSQTSTSTIDQIGPIHSDASPPRRAEILFAFWDTFSATTPSQALRAWDGAHSGPGRSRHGLRNLLSAVKAHNVPVFLLDLKTPTALSALDFLGVLSEIQNLTDHSIAILPDVSRYEIPATTSAIIPITSVFDLPDSPFLYTSLPLEQLSGNYRVLFVSSDQLGNPVLLTHPYRWQDRTIIPVPEGNIGLTNLVPTPAGPSLDLRRALVQSALDPQSNYLLLGGELADTSWGDPASISPTLRYLTAHPWLQFLNADNLLTLRTRESIKPTRSSNPPGSQLTEDIYSALINTPSGPVTDLAWQMYFSLLTPASPELTELRAGYFGIVGHLLVAARWAAHPGSVTDCSIDFDWDGQTECILASPDFLATLEITGAHVLLAFVRRTDGVHQVIAPYAQFVVGLGDPSTWDPSRGIGGDPALVPGGFFDNGESWIPQVQNGQISFSSAEENFTKTFYLTKMGLHVEYRSELPRTAQISIGLDPWQRFHQGWGQDYRETISSGGWEWAIDSGPRVKITTSGTFDVRAFTASLLYLSDPEDPNFDYPPGHYIPFPLALVEIRGPGDFYIDMEVR